MVNIIDDLALCSNAAAGLLFSSHSFADALIDSALSPDVHFSNHFE
jgi:hypothetical protein